MITEWCESEHFRYASQSSKQIVLQLPWIGTAERVHASEGVTRVCQWPQRSKFSRFHSYVMKMHQGR